MQLGRILIAAGILLAALGVLVMILERANLPLGRLPGDIVWRGKNSTLYFPVVTCIVLSILGSAVLWLINRKP